VQDTSNFARTICATEGTMKSRSAISNTFHNDVDVRNPSQSKTRRRPPLPTSASVSSPMYNKPYQSRTVKAVSAIAHAPTTYGL